MTEQDRVNWYNSFVDRIDELLNKYNIDTNAFQVDPEGNLFIEVEDFDFYGEYGDILIESRATIYTDETEEGQTVVLVDFETENGDYWYTDEIGDILID